MNLFTKQKQTYRFCKQTYDYEKGMSQRGVNQKLGMNTYTEEVKWSEVAQSCRPLCDPMGCSPPSSSIHRIFQARIVQWVAIAFSRGSSWPRDRTQVSSTAGRRFTVWATREAWTHTLLFIKQITNKNLLYSTGNPTQYSVITYTRKES